MEIDLKDLLIRYITDSEIQEMWDKYKKAVNGCDQLTDFNSFPFYRDYVSKFEIIPAKLPSVDAQVSDMEILQKFLASSYNIRPYYEFGDDLELEFVLFTPRGEMRSPRRLSSFLGFQMENYFGHCLIENIKRETELYKRGIIDYTMVQDREEVFESWCNEVCRAKAMLRLRDFKLL